MLKRHTPRWVLSGALLLAAVAGCVNAVTVLSSFHAVTHMTGTLAAVSLELGRGNALSALKAAGVVISFFLGSVFSGVLVRTSKLGTTRRYGVALLVEGALLFIGWLGLAHEVPWSEVFAAAACGLQNALATSYSGAIIRTTHMTGVVTDLGQTLGHWLARETVEWFRVRLQLVLLLGFSFGGAAGAFGFPLIGVHTLLFPAVLVTLTGAGWFVWQHRAALPS